MPSYRAIANGNWSATSTWNVWNGSAWVAATVVPTTGDDVWSNNFTVTINQDVTVLTLRNVNTSAPGTGTNSGGGFQITSGGFTLTVTTTIISSHVTAVAAGLIRVLATSGVTTLNVSYTSTNSAANTVYISITGEGCTVNINGTLRGGQFNSSGSPSSFFQSGTNTINLVGDIICDSNFSSAAVNQGVVVLNGNATFNVIGNLTVSSSVGMNCHAMLINSQCTVNVIGNLVNQLTTASSTNCAAIFAVSSATITITGNITAPTVTTSYGLFSSANTFITHTGICTGGSGSANGTGGPGIFVGGSNSITILSGPFIFGDYGAMPFNCTRVFFSNNINKYMEFATNSTNGALFPNAAPTRTSMFSPNSVVDGPAPSNVRFGVVYANGTVVGTMRVPNPNQVSKGVQTDNTVGVAALSPQDVWGQLLANINTPNSIGERLKDAATVQSTGDQIASLQ